MQLIHCHFKHRQAVSHFCVLFGDDEEAKQVSIAIHEARMSAYCSRSHHFVKNALQALSRKHKLKLEIDCGYYFFRSIDRARGKNSDFIVSLHRMIELEAIN